AERKREALQTHLSPAHLRPGFRIPRQRQILRPIRRAVRTKSQRPPLQIEQVLRPERSLIQLHHDQVALRRHLPDRLLPVRRHGYKQKNESALHHPPKVAQASRSVQAAVAPIAHNPPCYAGLMKALILLACLSLPLVRAQTAAMPNLPDDAVLATLP